MRTKLGRETVRVGRELVEVAETCFFMLAWGVITVVRRRRHHEGR